MEHWKTYKLGELVNEVFSGGTPSTTNETYWNGKLNWLSSGETRNKFITDTEKKISDLAVKESSTRLAKVGDIVIASAGQGHTRGQTSICKIDTYINQSVVAIRTNPKTVNPYWLFYNLSNRYEELRGISDSHSIRGSLTTKLIKGLDIFLPPIEEQKAIAKILSSLDDKIELNRQMNATLEAMAKALFKAWFIDFEPVRANMENRPSESASSEIAKLFPSKFENDIPKGWRNIKLEELIDTISVTHKFPNEEIVFLNTSDISAGQVLSHKYSQVKGLPGQAKKSIKKNDILYSEIRPANKRFAYIDFNADDYVVSTKLMVLRAKSFADPVLIYYFLKSEETISHLQMLAESRSGTFPQITFEQIKRLEMLISNKEVLELYTKFLKAILEKTNQNIRQNLKLAEIRDSLVPRLMLGKIPVSQIENEIKEATE